MKSWITSKINTILLLALTRYFYLIFSRFAYFSEPLSHILDEIEEILISLTRRMVKAELEDFELVRFICLFSSFFLLVIILKGSVSSSIPCMCRPLLVFVPAIFMAHENPMKMATTKANQETARTRNVGWTKPFSFWICLASEARMLKAVFMIYCDWLSANKLKANMIYNYSNQVKKDSLMEYQNRLSQIWVWRVDDELTLVLSSIFHHFIAFLLIPTSTIR